MKKGLGIVYISLAVLCVLYWVFSGDSFFSDRNIDQTASALNAFPVEEKIPDSVLLTFGGDVMFDRGVKGSVNKNFKGDYSELFKNVDIFTNDDISFVNLEGPVSDVGHNVGSIYSFRMNPAVIDVLKKTGIDIVSFANNHVGDYSSIAFKDTMQRLTNGNVLFTGAGENYADAREPKIIEKNNIKTCYLGFTDVGPNWMKATDTAPGILLATDPNFIEIIALAKTKCDVLIVSMHWGDEYKPHTSRQEKLARLAIDSGADIIVGHHPHVAQDIEIYNGKPIFYSLGNLIFDQYFSTETMQGLVVQVRAYKNGEVKDVTEFVSQQNRLFQIESVLEKP